MTPTFVFLSNNEHESELTVGEQQQLSSGSKRVQVWPGLAPLAGKLGPDIYRTVVARFTDQKGGIEEEEANV